MRTLILSLAALIAASASPASAKESTTASMNRAVSEALVHPGEMKCAGRTCVLNTGSFLIYGDEIGRYMRSQALSGILGSMVSNISVATIESSMRTCGCR